MEKYSLFLANWKLIGDTFNNMYFNNNYLSPYSDYCFLSAILKHSNIRQKKIFKECVFCCYILFLGETPLYIAPLFVNNKEKTIFLAGHFNSVGHIDFIYDKDVQKKDFEALIKLLSEKYAGFSLSLDRISQFSKTYTFIKSMNIDDELEKEICVKIDFDNYEKWFLSLPRGHRQNIRTAYNRINRENHKLSFCFFLNQKPEKHFYNDHISLFSRRILEHSKISKVFFLPMMIFKKNDSLSKALLNYKNNIFSGLYLNKKLIGSLNGVIGNDGRFIVTRLSINKDYGVYCPGGLLINETIKRISEKKDSSINSLDLSRGDEKYKFTYGGTEHYNYSFKIRLEK